MKAIASRSNDSIVFAGARNPAAATALAELVQKFSGRVQIVKLTSCDKDDNDAAVKEIERIAGRLDIVIANAGVSDIMLHFNPGADKTTAGISTHLGPALTTPDDQLREHFNVHSWQCSAHAFTYIYCLRHTG